MKIRCKVCENTDGTVCLVKGSKVAQNKSRLCELFVYAPEKVKTPTKMEAIYTPFHLRSKKEYKLHILEEQAKQKLIDDRNATINGDTPISFDCLKHFRATVTG